LRTSYGQGHTPTNATPKYMRNPQAHLAERGGGASSSSFYETLICIRDCRGAGNWRVVDLRAILLPSFGCVAAGEPILPCLTWDDRSAQLAHTVVKGRPVLNDRYSVARRQAHALVVNQACCTLVAGLRGLASASLGRPTRPRSAGRPASYRVTLTSLVHFGSAARRCVASSRSIAFVRAYARRSRGSRDRELLSVARGCGGARVIAAEVEEAAGRFVRGA
jgi:hypothetical protein